MNRRTRVALISAVLAALLLGIAAVAGPRLLERRRAIDAVEAYDAALVRSLASLDPGPMDAVAEPREVQRVANYVTLLWGTGRRMESRLESLELETLRSAEPTLVATVSERWSYTEYDRVSGRALGPARSETRRLRYELLPRGGRLVVALATEVAGRERR